MERPSASLPVRVLFKLKYQYIGSFHSEINIMYNSINNEHCQCFDDLFSLSTVIFRQHFVLFLSQSTNNNIN